MKEDFAPAGVLQNSQFLRPITNDLIERTALLLTAQCVRMEGPNNTYIDTNVGYRYSYTNDGKVQTETLPNNEILTYDDTGKVTTVHNPANGAAVTNTAYTYDENGNIQTISENGTQKVKYSYDSSNELTREDNVWQNDTITYTYDVDGNILTKTTYSYTTLEDLSTQTPTHTYNYQYNTDPNIKDQLTSYDGNAITYDTNGNVTAYDGWGFTWSGSQLSTASNTDNNISYQYNADGIRTHKTVNGVTIPIRLTTTTI